MSAEEAGRAAARGVVGTYERFHQRPPDGTRRIQVPEIPDNMDQLGHALGVIYNTDGQASARSGVDWEHMFGDTGHGDSGARPVILAHPTEPMLVIVPEPGEQAWQLTEDGIVG